MQVRYGIYIMTKVPKHIFTAASSWIARAISASVQIVCIRCVVDALGPNGYSVFALLSALLAWAVLFDFGVGNALQNYISEKRVLGQAYYSHIWFAGKLCIASMVLILLILAPLSSILSPLYLKSANHLDVLNKWILFYLSMSVFTFATIGSVVYKIWYAEQKGWIANIVISASSLCGLLFVYLCGLSNTFNKVEFFILAFYVPQAVISFVCFIYRIINSRKYLCLNGDCSFNIVRDFLCRSSSFWGFTAISTVVLQADTLVLSQKISSDEMVLYFIMSKLFGLVGFVYTSLLQAIWPVCAELRILNQWGKLESLVMKYVFFGVALVVFSGACIYILRNHILNILSVRLASDIHPLLFVLFSAYLILRVWSDTYAMLLQSMNTLRPLWYIVPFQAVVSLGLQWYLADKFGIYGILTGLITSFICTVCIYLPIVYKRKVKELSYE